jgi:uncharacterized protein (TIGR02001 family)
MSAFRLHRLLIQSSLAAGAAFLVSGAASGAAAQSFSGQIGLATEYVGKGLGKSDGHPAISGSFQIENGDFYASAFVSSADVASGAHAEVITAVGYRPTFGGVKFDLQVMNRDLPGTRAGVDSNYWEYQADVSRKFGSVNTRFRVNYTPDGFAATKEAWWVELQGTVALDARTRVSAAVADRSAQGGSDYVAWNLGVKRALTDAVSADLRWYDTDGHDIGETYEGRLVGALTYAF